MKEIDAMLNVVVQTAKVIAINPIRTPRGVGELYLKAQSRLMSLIPGNASSVETEAQRLTIAGIQWVVTRKGDNMVAQAHIDALKSTAVATFKGTQDIVKTLTMATKEVLEKLKTVKSQQPAASKKKKVSSVETAKSKKAKAKKVKS
jgi:hypothetical protein